MRAHLLALGLFVAAPAFAQTVGSAAPVFTLRPLNGDASKLKIVSLEDYVGPEKTTPKKAVLVAFTNGACESCKRDMAFFKTLLDEYKSKDLYVLVVDTDKDDDGAIKVAAWATAQGAEFPILNDRFGVAANRYNVQKTPAAFLIDGDEKIVKADIGYDDSAYPDIINATKQALGVADAEPLPAALQPFLKPEPRPQVVEKPAAETPAAVDNAPAVKTKHKRPPRTKKTAQAQPQGPKRIGHKPAE